MKTVAYKFLSACMAGLALSGINEEGEIEWIGTDRMWQTAKLNMQLFEEGLLPNDTGVRKLKVKHL